MARLTLDRLSMRFRTRRGESVTALQDISFEIKDREFAVLVGTSGCGKSTILRLVAGLLPPSDGRVLLDGRAVSGPGPERGMVFQSYTLFPWLTVQQNVEFGPRLRGDAAGQARGGRRALHRLGRAGWLRERLPEGAVRRDDAAGRHRAGAGERSRGAADGRALRRPRRPDPVPDGRAAPAGVGRGGEDGPVRDARHRGGPVPRRSGVRHDRPARTHPGGDPGPAARGRGPWTC